MVLQDYKIDGDYISISKKELENLRDHYHNVAKKYPFDTEPWWNAFYLGKRDVCLDILKMFEPLIGE